MKLDIQYGKHSTIVFDIGTVICWNTSERLADVFSAKIFATGFFPQKRKNIICTAPRFKDQPCFCGHGILAAPQNMCAAIWLCDRHWSSWTCFWTVSKTHASWNLCSISSPVHGWPDWGQVRVCWVPKGGSLCHCCLGCECELCSFSWRNKTSSNLYLWNSTAAVSGGGFAYSHGFPHYLVLSLVHGSFRLLLKKLPPT